MSDRKFDERENEDIVRHIAVDEFREASRAVERAQHQLNKAVEHLNLKRIVLQKVCPELQHIYG